MPKRSVGHRYLIPILISWMRPSHSFSSTKERTSSMLPVGRDDVHRRKRWQRFI